ncbi:MAG: 2-C-methyl-D-erythritol 4-phosphate cytidylyltransferase [Candidatus Saganbacteria bacterium]|nr:2-C-methyl-D-erythritol 4-phosphate cytidylyltransferase [Candidatus Saganbacteria bacterium]
MKTSVIITAGGYGKRMGSPSGKQFLEIAGKPILEWTISAFLAIKEINEVIVVINKEDFDKLKHLKVKLAEAGERRQDSVYNGLQKVTEGCDIVVIHDGARPLVTSQLIRASIAGAALHGASVVAVSVKDTIKEVSAEGFILNTADRSLLWAAQTPQTFKYHLIKEAYEKAKSDGFFVTDDASLVERLGYPVKIVEGSYENIKVTTPEDLAVAEQILRLRK